MTRLHPMPDPEGQLERLPDGPLCRHTCSVAFAAALELLASVGALRPFGVIMDSQGVVHLRVPPPASRGVQHGAPYSPTSAAGDVFREPLLRALG